MTNSLHKKWLYITILLLSLFDSNNSWLESYPTRFGLLTMDIYLVTSVCSTACLNYIFIFRIISPLPSPPHVRWWQQVVCSSTNPCTYPSVSIYPRVCYPVTCAEVLTHKATPVPGVQHTFPQLLEVQILYVNLNCGLMFFHNLVVIIE